jgi:hypothetical protein
LLIEEVAKIVICLHNNLLQAIIMSLNQLFIFPFLAAYYTMLAPDSLNLRVVVLNTNLYYDSNDLTQDMPDPANQLQWFDDVLTAAAGNNEKASIIFCSIANL